MILATNDINQPTDGELWMLKNCVADTVLTDEEKERVWMAIESCSNYVDYQQIQYYLEQNQRPIDQIVNPLQRDINNHLKKLR